MQKPFVTKYTQALADALTSNGMNVTVEYTDGHKTVDIAILDAKLFIEVDGLQHFTNSEQIERDFKRDHYSDGDDFATIRIPNIVLEHHLDEVADAIVQVVKIRLNPK